MPESWWTGRWSPVASSHFVEVSAVDSASELDHPNSRPASFRHCFGLACSAGAARLTVEIDRPWGTAGTEAASVRPSKESSGPTSEVPSAWDPMDFKKLGFHYSFVRVMRSTMNRNSVVASSPDWWSMGSGKSRSSHFGDWCRPAHVIDYQRHPNGCSHGPEVSCFEPVSVAVAVADAYFEASYLQSWSSVVVVVEVVADSASGGSGSRAFRSARHCSATDIPQVEELSRSADIAVSHAMIRCWLLVHKIVRDSWRAGRALSPTTKPTSLVETAKSDWMLSASSV